MNFEKLTTTFPWYRYSKKLAAKILKPRNVGFFTEKNSEDRNMRLVVGKEGALDEGNVIAFYWLVDREDGVIVDAKFQVMGQSALIGAAEVACDLIVGKNYDQARRIGADLIDKQVRDKSDTPSFPPETGPHLNLVLEAIEIAADFCTDIPLAATYVAPPTPVDFGEVLEGGYPGWDELSVKQKTSVIEEVLNSDIRPYIALDGGGVDLIEFRDAEKEVVIAYQGNCTSCYSAAGATLSYIQQMIKARVHPDLTVTPELGDFFK